MHSNLLILSCGDWRGGIAVTLLDCCLCQLILAMLTRFLSILLLLLLMPLCLLFAYFFLADCSLCSGSSLCSSGCWLHFPFCFSQEMLPFGFNRFSLPTPCHPTHKEKEPYTGELCFSNRVLVETNSEFQNTVFKGVLEPQKSPWLQARLWKHPREVTFPQNWIPTGWLSYDRLEGAPDGHSGMLTANTHRCVSGQKCIGDFCPAGFGGDRQKMFLEDFVGTFPHNKEERKSGSSSILKKSNGSKTKIRETTVLPKPALEKGLANLISQLLALNAAFCNNTDA